MKSKNFIKFTLLVIAIATVTSCSTYKKVAKHPEKYCHICIESENSIIEYRDTIIYQIKEVEVPLPGDTVYITKILTVNDGKVNLEKHTEINGIITVEYAVINNILDIRSYLNDSTITVNDTVIKEIHTETSSTIKTPKPIKERYIPLWIPFLWGASLVFVGWVTKKFL